jgi:hypothetical protein
VEEVTELIRAREVARSLQEAMLPLPARSGASGWPYATSPRSAR